jgi:hypothetical protein
MSEPPLRLKTFPEILKLSKDFPVTVSKEGSLQTLALVPSTTGQTTKTVLVPQCGHM